MKDMHEALVVDGVRDLRMISVSSKSDRDRSVISGSRTGKISIVNKVSGLTTLRKLLLVIGAVKFSADYFLF